MAIKIFRVPGVCELRGVARSTHYQDICRGLWTKPVPLGARAVGWPESECDALNAARIRGASETEIRELVQQLEVARGALLEECGTTINREISKRPDALTVQGSDCKSDYSRPADKRSVSTFIQVDKDYALGADSACWHFLQRKPYKGNYRWEPIASYTTVEQCANALADRAVRTCGAQSLSKALAEAKRVTSALCRALQAHFHVQRRTG